MSPGQYEAWTGDMSICTTCGAIVHFNWMNVHTGWHEGRWQEPRNQPKDPDVHSSPEPPGPGSSRC